MSQAAATDGKSHTASTDLADSFSKSVLLIGTLMIAQRAIGFLRSFYVCGALSPAEVGRWDLGFSFLMLVAPLAVLGIPGSFGRYVARYERINGQDRFLKHTSVVCLILSLLASMLIWWFREIVATYFFGSPAETDLVALMAIGLTVVVFFNFSTSWFTGRRMNRFVFRIQFTQTLFFALLCVATFSFLSVTAHSVIIAYLVSCLIGVVLAAGYVVTHRSSGEQIGSTKWMESSTAAQSIWKNILPFAVWVWASNALINLFTVCDRLLLVNFYSGPESEIQSLIGQYHTACIFPLLLMTVGAMAASTGMPYLSKDWEAGRHDAVVDRMNLMLKAIGLICFFASVGILLIAPFFFGVIWKDKFALGEALLPMTLSYCSLAAMTFVAQKYFWCLEKTWISSLFLFIGLVVNFLAGILLIGRYGIEGVVASTLIAHALVLIGILWMSRQKKMRVELGVFLVVATIVVLSAGKIAAVIGGFALLGITYWSEWLFSVDDRKNVIRYIGAKMPHLNRGSA